MHAELSLAEISLAVRHDSFEHHCCRKYIRGGSIIVSSVIAPPESLLDPQCSILDPRCSMFDARCSMLDARCSMLDARCSMLDARCSILDARSSVLGPRSAFREMRCPSTWRAEIHFRVTTGGPRIRGVEEGKLEK